MSSGKSNTNKKRPAFIKTIVSLFTVLILVLAFSAFTFADETDQYGQNVVVDASLTGEGQETETKNTSSVSGTLNNQGGGDSLSEDLSDNLNGSGSSAQESIKPDSDKTNQDDASVKQNNEKLNSDTDNLNNNSSEENSADSSGIQDNKSKTDSTDDLNEKLNSPSDTEGADQNTQNVNLNENIADNTALTSETAEALTPMLASEADPDDIVLSDTESAEEDPGTVTIQGLLVEKTVEGKTVTVLEKLEGLDKSEFLNKADTAGDKAMAIENAIKAAATQAKKLGKQGTILISLTHGEYEDDLKLTGDNEALKGIDLTGLNFTLVSADCYSVNTEKSDTVTFDKTKAVKGVNMNGEVSLEDISITLYGIYLSLGKITAKNSDLTVVGTTDSDTISVDVSSYDTPKIEIDQTTGKISKEEFTESDKKKFSLVIDGNDGDDNITVNQDGYAYQGNGSTLAPHSETMTMTIDGGNGDDTITVVSGGTQNVKTTINGGKGNDTISYTASAQTVEQKVEQIKEYKYETDPVTGSPVIDPSTNEPKKIPGSETTKYVLNKTNKPS
ncbi:MAG: hypothetical protein HUJ75_03595, partial [Parasporobacterium sp.]|nr:hypothetical protein [Parasporobacterium sp.]